MQVILLEKVSNLGHPGEKVNVRPGYGRNFLIPQKKAISATPANLAKYEANRAELEKSAAERLRIAQERADTLIALTVTINAKAGEEGKLFGSIGTKEIADAITAAGVSVQKSEVNLPNGVLRQTGDYDIRLQLHSDVTTTVKVTVAAEA